MKNSLIDTIKFTIKVEHGYLIDKHKRLKAEGVSNRLPESVTIPPAPSTAPINIPRCLPTAPPIDANDAQSQ